MPQLLLLVFLWLLFESGYNLRAATIWGRLQFKGGDYLRVATIRGQCIYSFGKPTDINDSWIRYIRTSNAAMTVRHCQRSLHSPSVLLSGVEMGRALQTPLALVWLHMCVFCVYYPLLFEGGVHFTLDFPIVQLPFKGGDYSKKYMYGMKDMYTISKLSIPPT